MNTATYEVISSFTIISSRPSIFCSILGFASKGTKIEVVSITNDWAFFYYNGKNAYIRLSSLNVSTTINTGSVIIKYIDETTRLEIDPKTIYTNLAFGSYSYSSKSISGYSLVGNSTQSIELTNNNPNVTITFSYKKILGSVTIYYIDKTSQMEINIPTIINNLKLNNYTFNAIEIPGYSVLDAESQLIFLTETAPNNTIIFYYEVKYLQIDISKQNEVPYISTYYIKPIIAPGEEAIINFYITDYYHKEYINEDFSEEFSVTVVIDGNTTIVTRNLKAGDQSINLGSFFNIGEQKFSILCTDQYGRKSHELFNFFLVKEEIIVKEYIMTEDDLLSYKIKNNDSYEIQRIISLNLTTTNSTTVKAALQIAANNIVPPSKTYICVIADTNNDGKAANWWAETIVKYSDDYNKAAVLQEATNTRFGLQQLLDNKKSQGYNSVKLLPGIYRIDNAGTIFIPSEFTLNMNGATLKLNQFTGGSALMIDINNTFDSHVINGTIEGDYFSHDYANSPNNSEWVNGISVGGESKYSSYENIILKDITGYGSGNGIANSRDKKLGYTYLYPKAIGNTFKLGDIDRNSGLDITSTNRTTCSFVDINGYSEIGYLSVSIYLGYQGNPCGTWNLICHFYDINKLFIKSTDAYQYRRIAVPSNAKFMKVTILSESYPTNLSIHLFRIPTHCAFKNIKHQNCRCVGMAQSAMKDMLVENCEYTNCGQTSAKCAYDAEDGWDMMQDVTFKELNFYNNPNNDFLTCAGHNFVVDGQVSGKIYIWERTRSMVVKNCKNINITLQSGGNTTIVKHGVYRVYNNQFTGGTVANNLSKDNKCTGGIGGLVSNSILGGLVDDSIYNNCTINVSTSFLAYISKISMINCKFIPLSTFTDRYKISFNGGHLNSNHFENCIFKGKSTLSNHGSFYSGNFLGCTFEDTNITANVSANNDDIISFDNCDFGYSGANFIYYSPFAYTKGTFTNLQFNNCIIKNIDNNTKSFIYAYAKPNGSCTFTNCNLALPQNIIIFDGYPTNLNFITDYSLQFTKSSLPNSIQLVSAYYKNNPNIKVSVN